jgi:hypothetical protein
MKSYCIIEMSNINEGIVNDITLKYFTNKEFASKTHKHLETKTPNVKSKDKKFYRKRMMALTKYLLYDNKTVRRKEQQQNGSSKRTKDTKW